MTAGLMTTVVEIAVLVVALMTAKVEGYTKTQQVENGVEVHLRQGLIFAPWEEAGEGRYFYSFKGIPYAQPPVGNLRFKDPLPAGGWQNVRNGSMAQPLCPQLSVEARLQGRREVTGSEDCLYLNVYTPAPLPTGLPVMVWIHGGAFQDGGGEDLYAPLPFMTKDIILVAVHFRLGTLGYLSTEDSVMPGNLGLKDATLALRWVQDNIRDLGGDPAKVTIFGESSGAATVHFQLLTPKANGLFRRAIMQSGSALCSWAVREDHRQVALKMAESFQCSHQVQASAALDSHQLLACFQQIPVEQLVLSAYAFRVWSFWPTVMRPRVDGDYLPDHPATLIRSGKFNKVDIISGVTQHEGSTDSMGILVNKTLSDTVEQNFSVAGPASLLLEAWDDTPVYLASRAYYHYLGETGVTVEKAEEFMQLISDAYFNVAEAETAHFHTIWRSPHSPKVFRYELQHRGQLSLADGYNSSLNKNWVGHADDLQYLFNGKPSIRPRMRHSADLFVRDIMLTLWTNFAATGNPTPDGSLGFRWWPTSESNQWYLAITTSPTMKDDSPVQVLEFWKNLPTKKNQLLYPECFLEKPTCLARPGHGDERCPNTLAGLTPSWID